MQSPTTSLTVGGRGGIDHYSSSKTHAEYTRPSTRLSFLPGSLLSLPPRPIYSPTHPLGNVPNPSPFLCCRLLCGLFPARPGATQGDKAAPGHARIVRSCVAQRSLPPILLLLRRSKTPKRPTDCSWKGHGSQLLTGSQHLTASLPAPAVSIAAAGEGPRSRRGCRPPRTRPVALPRV